MKIPGCRKLAAKLLFGRLIDTSSKNDRQIGTPGWRAGPNSK
jgi:hypothetical protein